MVGCGGTGSQLSQALARLVFTLNQVNRPTALTFIDFDQVEEKNLGRQIFCPAELHQNKAIALATRYGHALGIAIEAYTRPFATYQLKDERECLTVLIGSVDNHHARREMARTLASHTYRAGQLLWLDCSNFRDSGKVLIGNAHHQDQLRQCFPVPQACSALPAPSLTMPQLLEPEGYEEVEANLSCADLINLRLQSLNVNMMTATIAANYLTKLLLEHNLKSFATYFDLGSGSMRSEYITPEAIARVARIKPERLIRQNKREQRSPARAR